MHESLSDEELNVCIRAVAAQPAELLEALGTHSCVPVGTWCQRTASATKFYVTFVDPTGLAPGQGYATWVITRLEPEAVYRVGYFLTRAGAEGDTIPPPAEAVATVPWVEPHGKVPLLTLLVLRCADLQRSRAFYAALACQPHSEQHGSGLRHFSMQFGSTMLELYPALAGEATAPIRLGLVLTTGSQALRAITRCGGSVVREVHDAGRRQRWLLRDPDQNLLEVEIL